MKKAFCGFLCLMLAGCMSLTSKEPAPTIYALQAGNATPVPVMHRVVIVPEPQVPQGFATDQIALHLEGGRRFDYYLNVRWPAEFDRVLQDFVIESARRVWPNAVVARPDFGVPADSRLAIQLIDFEPVYGAGPDGVPVLKVGMSFTLLSVPDGKILCHFSVSDRKAASANTQTAVAAGLNALAKSVVARALTRVGRAEPYPPAPVGDSGGNDNDHQKSEGRLPPGVEKGQESGHL
ncbi:MAG TPA: hypothetical protein VL625_10665 [Patescibacteria group bacterium]|nr:hypothetical protein [Patescibacteria group bacterium]